MDTNKGRFFELNKNKLETVGLFVVTGDGFSLNGVLEKRSCGVSAMKNKDLGLSRKAIYPGSFDPYYKRSMWIW